MSRLHEGTPESHSPAHERPRGIASAEGGSTRLRGKGLLLGGPEAEASDKPLLLVFSASWCPPCIVMKHEVWPDAEVSLAVNQGFVPLHIDVDDSRDAAITARYDIRGIPAVLIVDAQGKVLRQESFMSRWGTLKFLDTTAS